MRGSEFLSFAHTHVPSCYIDTQALPQSDYKDDGTNILLDANENAYGPSLPLNGARNIKNDLDETLDFDCTGLHRYPDPYV